MKNENKPIIFSSIIAASAAIVASLLTSLVTGHFNELNNQKLIDSTKISTDKTIDANFKSVASTNKTNKEMNQKLIASNLVAVEKTIKSNFEAVRLSNETHFKKTELTLQNNLEAIKKNNENLVAKERRELEKEKIEAANLITGDLLSRLLFLEGQLKMYNKMSELSVKDSFVSQAIVQSLVFPSSKMFFVEDFQHYFSKNIAILPKECTQKVVVIYRMLETQQKMLKNLNIEPTDFFKRITELRKIYQNKNLLNEKIDLILGRLLYYTSSAPFEMILSFTASCISTGYYTLACLNEYVLNDLEKKLNYENKANEFKLLSDKISKEIDKKNELFFSDFKEIINTMDQFKDDSFPEVWFLKQKLFSK